MQETQIKVLDRTLDQAITEKINGKTKPLGSLGQLETVGAQICRIQHTLQPKLEEPAILVCAGDHGITQEGISPFPQEVTFQMVMNFLAGGAAINVFSRQHNINLLVADTGVNFDFESTPQLLNKKVAKGTRNFAVEPAMSIDQCKQAMQNGADMVTKLHQEGTNIIGFGEMGIGNTTSAAALLCKYAGVQPEQACGAGTGLDQKGIQHKAEVIEKALKLHQAITSPLEILACFGGFETATICGAMLKAAELKMIIMVDGFIVTSALLAAHAMQPQILDYCIFTHQSNEQGHQHMLSFLRVNALLNIGMRLGEGTGAAVAYPLIQSAVAFINEMSSFADAGVSNR
ncbi:nicotinate-nucleotide--dimethylbenzimidazole phosphoribosyltransferase [Carboxylicivirga linearis]|uniref:Nicotinate-nucleotide--dimethylbenzimidazole phosphoribosyltransferase n=1 Tax=Carboxylicivirga linearis TaxID=1628157 RepID=A0ABS5JR65_9BACT|nr:nicotinate-nucleotide--dimethylbenzimidazole phosphoribosyltransferase [Carboxylicivirga linearis]MBS2097320.1 nicotinate-nucleotide--dimethylbenzimidazole phosphoribosyltransferase [Carboxylicivirga linearis]